jgi:sedoheptulose-bisphosphatase
VEDKAKIFSPANLRAANDLPGYKRIIDEWIAQRMTLRYTGGMVPDVVGILVKGNGVFSSPVSENAGAKLRLVFEVAPIALIIELAGGLALAAQPGEPLSVLDIPIQTVNDRIGIICGSLNDVLDCFRSIYNQPV